MSTSTHTSTTTSQTGGRDKLAALHEQISDGVAALVESQGWRAMLDTAAKFHSYSLGNLLLIGAQAPQATRVAGFRTWQSVGRQVRKGERGIAILAPCTYRPKAADQAETAGPAGPAGHELATTCSGGVAPDAGGKQQVRGFRVVHVFALHQTEGAPLPEVAPSLLVGQAPAGLWDALEGQVHGHGYTVHRGDTSPANGWTDPTTRTVRVSGDVDDAQAVKTLIHELGAWVRIPKPRISRARVVCPGHPHLTMLWSGHLQSDFGPTLLAHLEAGHVGDLPRPVRGRGREHRVLPYVDSMRCATAAQ